MNVLPQRPSLQSIAAKCTKVGSEQPSKQPLKVAPKVRQIGKNHGGLPEIAREPRRDQLVCNYNIERARFIKRAATPDRFEPHWRRLTELLEEALPERGQLGGGPGLEDAGSISKRKRRITSLLRPGIVVMMASPQLR